MFKGTPYVNRHIKRRDEERSMDFHRFNLTHIRPYPTTIEQVDGIIGSRVHLVILTKICKLSTHVHTFPSDEPLGPF